MKRSNGKYRLSTKDAISNATGTVYQMRGGLPYYEVVGLCIRAGDTRGGRRGPIHRAMGGAVLVLTPQEAEPIVDALKSADEQISYYITRRRR